MLKKLLSALLIILVTGVVNAQELNCQVRILHEKITGTDPQVFTAMQRNITDFLNSHKWTNEDYAATERIDCQMLINLTGKISGDADGYSATITIQASRPVYNSSYTSPTVNYVDRDFIFHYSQFEPLQFDDNRVAGTDPMTANLTAVLAYYSYLIIGLDGDSFAPEGGTVYLKKAQNVVNNAPEQGKTIAGWKAVDGTHNRYWIIDQLLNPRFDDFRSTWYKMHRDGLDKMYNSPADSRTAILAGITKLFNVNKENPSSILIQFFFNAKSDEILRIMAQVPKTDRGQYITMLSAMDVPDANKYGALR